LASPVRLVAGGREVHNRNPPLLMPEHHPKTEREKQRPIDNTHFKTEKSRENERNKQIRERETSNQENEKQASERTKQIDREPSNRQRNKKYISKEKAAYRQRL
jgi:hypothetical protein